MNDSIDISLNAYQAKALEELVGTLVSVLTEDEPLASDIPQEDMELADAWEDGLSERLQDDCHRLLELMNDARLGKDSFNLDINKAESILRASSAIRLKIRASLLEDIPAGELEGGSVDLDVLSPGEQGAYLCYLFLASLQDLIISQLDPSLETLDF